MSSEPFTWEGSDPTNRRGGYRETAVRTHRKDRHTSLVLRATRGTARFLGARAVTFIIVASIAGVCLLVASFGCAASASIEPITQAPPETVQERPGSPPTVAPAPVVLPEKSPVWSVLDDVLSLLAQYRRGEITIRDAMTWVQERRREESPAARVRVDAGGGATGVSAEPPARHTGSQVSFLELLTAFAATRPGGHSNSDELFDWADANGDDYMSPDEIAWAWAQLGGRPVPQPPAQQSAAVRGVQERSGDAFGDLPGGE